MKQWTLILFFIGCGEDPAGPAPIVLGEDACDHCRMIISDGRFAAEGRFARLEKFDDIGCLLRRKGEASAVWVADHLSGKLIEARQAWFVRSTNVVTPMASGLTAFSSRAAAESFAQKHNGTLLRFPDLGL